VFPNVGVTGFVFPNVGFTGFVEQNSWKSTLNGEGQEKFKSVPTIMTRNVVTNPQRAPLISQGVSFP